MSEKSIKEQLEKRKLRCESGPMAEYLKEHAVDFKGARCNGRVQTMKMSFKFEDRSVGFRRFALCEPCLAELLELNVT